MKILVSNDDGYHAPGLYYLVKSLSEIAEITVVAPDRNRSGASNSLTLETPLRVRQIKDNWYYVNGTPTDCVHLALTGLFDTLPDMVVSGINEGPNLGDDVLYSGTVAAAIEGRFLGLPSIAVSLMYPAKNYEAAAQATKEIVLNVSKNQFVSESILNVNVPDVPFSELGSFEITRLGKRHAAQDSIVQTDPRGNTVYWIGLPGEAEEAGPGSDFYAVQNNNVSMTPIKLDWTNTALFEHLTPWVKSLNQSFLKNTKK